jgi:DNA relaxase NicK
MSRKQYDLLFDWFECTFKHTELSILFRDFGIDVYDKRLTITKAGFIYYNTTFTLGEKIKFMVSLKDPTCFDKGLGSILTNYDRNMGVHLILSGYGCREFEKNFTFWWLLDYCKENKANMSRIDIAWDCFNDDLIKISTIKYYLKNGFVVTKARKALIFDEVETETGVTTGESVKFGSSASETMCMIYNKLQERKSADYVIDPEITHWVRIELRIRGESCSNLVQIINQNNFTEVANSALFNYLDFKEKNGYAQRSLWDTAQWWSEFIKVSSKLKLSSKAIQTSIQRKKAWLELSVSKTLAKVFLSDLEDTYGEQFNKLFHEGIKMFNELDMDQINAHRIEKGGSVLSGDDMFMIKKTLEDCINADGEYL